MDVGEPKMRSTENTLKEKSNRYLTPSRYHGKRPQAEHNCTCVLWKIIDNRTLAFSSYENTATLCVLRTGNKKQIKTHFSRSSPLWRILPLSGSSLALGVTVHATARLWDRVLNDAQGKETGSRGRREAPHATSFHLPKLPLYLFCRARRVQLNVHGLTEG